MRSDNILRYLAGLNDYLIDFNLLMIIFFLVYGIIVFSSGVFRGPLRQGLPRIYFGCAIIVIAAAVAATNGYISWW